MTQVSVRKRRATGALRLLSHTQASGPMATTMPMIISRNAGLRL